VYFSKPGGGTPVSHQAVYDTSFVDVFTPTVFKYSSNERAVPMLYCSTAVYFVEWKLKREVGYKLRHLKDMSKQQQKQLTYQ
jgi:hypothetical protein